MHKVLPFCALALSLVAAATSDAQSLRGSPTSIDRMFRQATRHDLPFYETSRGVRKALGNGALVRLSGNSDYQLKSVSHPYVLPSTRTFVHRLAAQYRARCKEKLVITSGTRPKSIRLVNSTSKSVHPTGMAVDLRKPRGRQCLSWLRETLSGLEADGVLEATEENRPPHFHVAVFPDAYGDVPTKGADAEEVKLAAAEMSAAKPALLTPARSTSSGASKAGTTSPRPKSSSSKSSPSKSSDKVARGRSYKVRRGESLWTIARRANVSVATLKRTNSLRSSRIVAGQVLIIPQ